MYSNLQNIGFGRPMPVVPPTGIGIAAINQNKQFQTPKNLNTAREAKMAPLAKIQTGSMIQDIPSAYFGMHQKHYFQTKNNFATLNSVKQSF